MVRSAHALLDHHHALWQYVDDLLTWLDKQTAPLWASALVILFLLLGIPLSWHKAALDVSLVWIGWSLSVETWTVQIPQVKLEKILTQIDALIGIQKVPLKDLQSLIGRLLWLTSAWHQLRPLLIPLYKALQHIPLTLVGVDHATFAVLTTQVDQSLTLMSSMQSKHHSLCAGVKILRVANVFVKDKMELQSAYLKSRRVWLGT